MRHVVGDLGAQAFRILVERVELGRVCVDHVLVWAEALFLVAVDAANVQTKVDAFDAATVALRAFERTCACELWIQRLATLVGPVNHAECAVILQRDAVVFTVNQTRHDDVRPLQVQRERLLVADADRVELRLGGALACDHAVKRHGFAFAAVGVFKAATCEDALLIELLPQCQTLPARADNHEGCAVRFTFVDAFQFLVFETQCVQTFLQLSGALTKHFMRGADDEPTLGVERVGAEICEVCHAGDQRLTEHVRRQLEELQRVAVLDLPHVADPLRQQPCLLVCEHSLRRVAAVLLAIRPEVHPAILAACLSGHRTRCER